MKKAGRCATTSTDRAQEPTKEVRVQGEDIANEEWRQVPGWQGYYKVSDTGQVKSLPRLTPRGQKGAVWLRGRLMKPTVRPDGYMVVGLSKEGVMTLERVHRLVLFAFVGPPPEGQMCRHLDGNPANNHLENLTWGTLRENWEDSVRHGTASPPPPTNSVTVAEREQRQQEKQRQRYADMKTHLKHSSAMYGDQPTAACRTPLPRRVTTDVEDVNCRGCKRTVAYREAS